MHDFTAVLEIENERDSVMNTSKSFNSKRVRSSNRNNDDCSCFIWILVTVNKGCGSSYIREGSRKQLFILIGDVIILVK